MIPVTYNVRSLFVRKTTTVATVLGIALVVFVLSSSQMLAHGIKRTMGSSGSRENAIVLRKGADAELSSNLENRLVGLIKSAPGVKRDASGTPVASSEVVVVVSAELADNPEQMANLLVRGVPGDVTRLRTEVRVVEGRPAKPGTNEAVIGRRILGRFRGVALGSTFELNKNRPVSIVGVMESEGSSFESEIWADLDVVRNAFGREGLVSSVTAALESPVKYDAFASAMESDKQLGLQVLQESEYYDKQSEGTAMFIDALGKAIVFFFSLGAIIGAMITMYAAVASRQREIGTLQALGFSKGAVLSSFLLEAVLLALLGGAIGAVASLGMSWVSFSMMNFATWSEVVFSFHPTVDIIASAIVVGGLMGVVGGFFPALKAARTSPIQAMRE